MNLIKEKEYYHNIIRFAIPVALQNLISFSINMMDTLMIGSLGEVSLSGVSLANQVFSFFSVFCFGLASGGSVIVSQYWGKKQMEPICKVISISLRFIMVVSILLVTILQLFPEFVMSIFTNDLDVIAEGTKYLKVVSISFLFFGFTNTLIVSLRGVEKVVISTFVYAVSFITNVVLNYFLIFGFEPLNIPKLGIVGAATATLISRIIELIIVLIYIFKIEKDLKFNFKYMFTLDKILLSKYFSRSLPVILNEFVWGLGMNMHAVIIGRLGTSVVAASSISTIIAQMSVIFVIGLANAAAVTTGKIIGEGDIEKAKTSARTLQFLSLFAGIGSAVFILITKDWFISLYNISESTKGIASNMVIAVSITTFFASIELISNIGVLRGGGDTKFVFFVDTFFMWVFSIPLGALAGFYFKLPPAIVYLILRSDSLMKSVCAVFRIHSDKWINDVTTGKEEKTEK